jgi:hypothetical protein
MVKIKGYLKRRTSDGNSFVVLELVGGVEVQKSQDTGSNYAKECKCTVPCTFDEETASNLVGTTLPGTIVKEPCEPYNYTHPTTGRKMVLNYKYNYRAPEVSAEQGKMSF